MVDLKDILSKEPVTKKALIKVCKDSTASDVLARLIGQPIGNFDSPQGNTKFWLVIRDTRKRSGKIRTLSGLIIYDELKYSDIINITSISPFSVSDNTIINPDLFWSALCGREYDYGTRLKHTKSVYEKNIADAEQNLSHSFLSQADITSKFPIGPEICKIPETAYQPFNSKILIVDNSKNARREILDILKNAGYNQIQEASSVSEAFFILRTEKDIKLIISDWDMAPGMNGTEFYKSLKNGKTGENYKKVPFILATGEERENIVKEALDLGIPMYVLKPISENKDVLLNSVYCLLLPKYIMN